MQVLLYNTLYPTSETYELINFLKPNLPTLALISRKLAAVVIKAGLNISHHVRIRLYTLSMKVNLLQRIKIEMANYTVLYRCSEAHMKMHTCESKSKILCHIFDFQLE